MERIIKLAGFLSVLISIFGALFKTFHLPGAGILIMVGGGLFGLLFIPLVIINTLISENKINKFLITLGWLFASLLSNGLLFKLMHWQGATVLLISGTIGFTVLFAPLYYFKATEIKAPQIYSIVIIAFGCLFFSLFDLGHSRKVDHLVNTHKFMHESAEKIFELNDQTIIDSADIFKQNVRSTTDSINTSLEHLVTSILSNENRANIELKSKELINSIQIYNQMLKTDKNVNQINTEDLAHIYPNATAVMLTILAKIQLNLATNEASLLK